MSSEEAANGKKSHWAELEISGKRKKLWVGSWQKSDFGLIIHKSDLFIITLVIVNILLKFNLVRNECNMLILISNLELDSSLGLKPTTVLC